MKLVTSILALSVNGFVTDEDGWEIHTVDETSVLGARGRSMDDTRAPTQRRYEDLEAMIEYLLKAEKNLGGKNMKFDETKIWSYGCHCLQRNDRGMSSMGHGKPVDAMDRICKEYKECQKCAFEAHPSDNSGSSGEGLGQYGCIGEFVKYNWKKIGRQTHPNYPMIKIVDNGSNNGCMSDLMMCDRQFAIKSVAEMLAETYDQNFSSIFSNFDPDSNEFCPKTGGSGSRECCGGWEAAQAPWVLYNTNKNTCDAGTIRTFGDLL
jgi:hypothetical protein